MNTTFEIVDRHTGRVVGTASTITGARRSVDRRDNAYGAYRYYYRRSGETRPQF